MITSEEFDKQVKNLLDKGYPKEILNYTEELKKEIENLSVSEIDLEKENNQHPKDYS